VICKKFGVRGTTRIEGITSEKERVRNLADGVADQLRNNAAPIIMRKGNHPKGTTPAMRVNENKERLRLKQIIRRWQTLCHACHGTQRVKASIQTSVKEAHSHSSNWLIVQGNEKGPLRFAVAEHKAPVSSRNPLISSSAIQGHCLT